jgi:hypothetical protein
MDVKLETKFIEGTDNQYSIRNDGVIISHYLKTRGINSYRDKILTVHTYNNCSIYIEGKKKTVSPQILLFQYFGFRRCIKCNEKHYTIENLICTSCDRERMKQDEEKRQTLLTRSYIAKCLQIPIEIMDEELYQSQKAIIKIKRNIAQKLNCSINSIK